MPTNHDVVAALPAAGGADHVLLRDLLVKRMAYCLADAEDSQDVVAIDPADGTTILVFLYKGLVYSLDPLDTTTAHDGVSCLVSYDSKRYKLNSLTFPTSALDKDLTSPPLSPSASIGDVYLIYGSPSGDWAGKSGYIAVYTSRGWEFVAPRVGQFIYLEDEGGYYHYDENGDWIAGVGEAALPSNSIKISQLIGGGGIVHPVIINQTTNDPPVSPAPSKGDAYIIGSSPTGAWAGHAGSLAVWEGSDWGIYTPAEGWRVYDIAQDNDYRFDGSAWVSLSGALRFFSSQFTAGTGSVADSGATTGYTYSSSTAPTTSNRRYLDSVTITRVARSGAKLRFRYSAHVTDVDSKISAIAIYRDSDVNAVAWIWNPIGEHLIDAEFLLSAPDASSHTYKIAVVLSSLPSSAITLDRRLFTIEEFA